MLHTKHYMGVVDFSFIPLQGKKLDRYAKGLEKAYTKELANTNAATKQSRVSNIKRGLDYLGEITSNNKLNKPQVFRDRYLLPIESEVRTKHGNKKATVGLRETYSTLFDDDYDTGMPIYSGNTITHPRYRNVGAKALMDTMINHAKDTPDRIHSIAGANMSLDRLYRQLSSSRDLPDNLELYDITQFYH